MSAAKWHTGPGTLGGSCAPAVTQSEQKSISGDLSSATFPPAQLSLVVHVLIEYHLSWVVVPFTSL